MTLVVLLDFFAYLFGWSLALLVSIWLILLCWLAYKLGVIDLLMPAFSIRDYDWFLGLIYVYIAVEEFNFKLSSFLCPKVLINVLFLIVSLYDYLDYDISYLSFNYADFELSLLDVPPLYPF